MPADEFECVLLTTLGCHLCDSAKRELWRAQERLGFSFAEQDIALSEDDVAKYGVRIPVVRSLSTGVEIDWPFSASDIVKLLQ